ncbi:MAG: hypothetical protein FJY65_08175 [Calditrichaeota bacterium]|nr:hypothetical protein [Calditrichota bacterium]
MHNISQNQGVAAVEIDIDAILKENAHLRGEIGRSTVDLSRANEAALHIPNLRANVQPSWDGKIEPGLMRRTVAVEADERFQCGR